MTGSKTHAGVLSLAVLASCYSGVEFDAPSSDTDTPLSAGGSSRGPDPDEDAGDDTDTGDGPAPSARCGPEAPSDHLLRLTRSQLENAVHDVFSVDVSFASSLPEDGRVGPFAVNGVEPPSVLLLESYLAVAEDVAGTVADNLGALLPCDPVVLGETACAHEFIETYGRRLFRRPLDMDEVDRYTALFETDPSPTFHERLTPVVAALVQSPNFLYRIETGQPHPDDPGTRRLSGFEVATRLSFFLWNSVPDDALLDAAEAGALDSIAGVEAQARRMLAQTDLVSRSLAEFHTRWLGIDGVSWVSKDPDAFPEFSEMLATDLDQEARLLTADIMLDGDARVATLLGANHTFVSPGLAELYGLTSDGDGFRRVELDPLHRAGILTLPAVMSVTSHTVQTSPVLRGKFVRERLLCQTVPPPPPTVDDTPPQVDPDASTKEQYEQHTQDPACASCHLLMDPIGFGFERYDAIGRLREVPDSRGEITATPDANGPFDSMRDLADLLRDSTLVRQCITRQWFWYAMSRGHGNADAATLAELTSLLDDSEGELRELIVLLSTTPQFGRRCLPQED